MGSSPQSCKICCFKNTNIVQGLPVQIYDDNDIKYLSQPNYSYIIFLQIRIKKYLHNRQALLNSNYLKLKTINTFKSNESSNNNINKSPPIENINNPKKIFDR